MKAYNRDREKKRLAKAVREQFSKPEKILSDNLPKKPIVINNKTVVLAPEAASLQNILNRYEHY
jgi:hypothetical protein